MNTAARGTSTARIASTPAPPAGRAPLSGERTSAILADDPATGLVRRVGQLARPLSDAAVAAVVNRVIVVGGETPAGRAVLDARADSARSPRFLGAARTVSVCSRLPCARPDVVVRRTLDKQSVPHARPAQAVTRDLSSREDHRHPDPAVEERHRQQRTRSRRRRTGRPPRSGASRSAPARNPDLAVLACRGV
jgi:hypothetical protein